MSIEARKARVESPQSSHPIGDLSPPLTDESRQLRGRVGAVTRVAPPSDPGCILKWDIKPTKLDQQP